MANLSNINNKFIVTDGGNVLIGNTANSSGRLQIKDTQTSNFNDGLAITRNNAAQTGYINMVGGAFNFNSPGLSYKFRNNGTQTLELNSSGDATFAGTLQSGNFAIGVAPSSFGTGVPTITLRGTAANGRGGAIMFQEQDGTVTTNIYSTDGADGYGTVINAAQSNFKVSVGALAATQLTISSTTAAFAGSVGIGGGTIEGKLSIDYTAAELPTSGTTSNSAIQVTSSLGNQLNLGLNTVSGSYGAYIQASDNNLAVLYPLNLQPNGGNVGIGTTSPTKKLQINAGTNRNLRVGIGIQGTTGIDIQSVNDAITANAPLTLSGSLIALMEGNVGIGTISPGDYDGESDDLVVFNSTTPGITIATDNTTSRGALRFADGTTGNERYRGALEYDHNTDLMMFRTQGAQVMTLYDGGRLHPQGGVFLGSSNNDQLLDYYKEGTWTPTIKDLNGNLATLSAASGTYTKIGRQVFLNYRVQLSSKASMANNYVLLGGLPFNHPTGTNGSGTIDYFQNMATGFSSLAWDTTSTGSVMWLVGNLGTSSTSSVYVTPAQLTDTTMLKGAIIYMAVT